MQRLKTRSQFQAVLKGSIVAKTEHFALHRNRPDAWEAAQARGALPGATPGQTCCAPEVSVAAGLFPVEDVWMGAMVPKRWAKRAVTRNAIKRQIYFVSADFVSRYPKAAFLVRLRREFSRREFPSATSVRLKEAVRTEVLALMQAGPGLT